MLLPLRQCEVSQVIVQWKRAGQTVHVTPTEKIWSRMNKSPFGGATVGQPATAAAPFGFGASATSSANNTGFGSSKTATGFGGISTGLSGFGAQGSTPFGAATASSTTGFGAAPTLGGGFGSQPAGFGAGSTFGQTPSLAGTSFGGFGNVTGQQMAPRLPTVVDRMKEIYGYWDPESPSCQFKHYFYNMVHTNEVQFYRCPPNQDPALFQQALQNNPDPTCMVPVLAVGFEDLKKRVNQQITTSQIHGTKLDELCAVLEKIEKKHYLETTSKLDEYKRRHVELSHRVLKIMKYVEILRNKGYSIRAEEEALRGRLEAMDQQLKKPAHFRGRTQELQATLRTLRESRKAGQNTLSGGSPDSDVIDEEQLRLMREALMTAQEGLKNVSAVIDEDSRDLGIVYKGYSIGPQTMVSRLE
ncbi:nucleoporin complex subunit 54-domain-containing protein [Zopfochytrium polystomum]|nr:nucleoporin complex subunit 54-domain-containing protein [Zopfochytrium polystomum]